LHRPGYVPSSVEKASWRNARAIDDRGIDGADIVAINTERTRNAADHSFFAATAPHQRVTECYGKGERFRRICAPSEESHFNDRIRDAAVGKAKP
jgi:hypothetical protein